MSASHADLEPNFVMVPPDPATHSVERLRRQALRLLTESNADSDAERAGAAERSRQAPSVESQGANRASSLVMGILAMPAAFLAIVLVALAAFGKPGDDTQEIAATPGKLAQPAFSRALSPSLAAATSNARGAISLADDTRIQSIALDGDRVALYVEGAAGRQIIVYDFREGRQIAAAAIETLASDAIDTLSMLTGPPPPTPAAVVEIAVSPNAEPRPIFTGSPTLKPRSQP